MTSPDNTGNFHIHPFFDCFINFSENSGYSYFIIHHFPHMKRYKILNFPSLLHWPFLYFFDKFSYNPYL